MMSALIRSAACVEKQNPRKGTETRSEEATPTNNPMLVEKQNPRKGTETAGLLEALLAAFVALKNKIPVRGRKLRRAVLPDDG